MIGTTKRRAATPAAADEYANAAVAMYLDACGKPGNDAAGFYLERLLTAVAAAFEKAEGSEMAAKRMFWAEKEIRRRMK